MEKLCTRTILIFFLQVNQNFMNVQVSKSKSKEKKKKKIGDIDFLISVYVLEVFLVLSTTFSKKI
jgi:hypothetical protein